MNQVIMRIAAGLCVAAIACLILAVTRGALGFVIVAVLVATCVAAYVFRARLLIGARAKMAEWSSDVKQLGLWLTLAFKRNRDERATATMAHQQAFLDGRIMSPLNLFWIAGFAILGSIGVVGFEEWRIHRIKAERDAPCTQRELTLNSRGQYQTSRASCSSLGATLGVAVQWQERADQIEAQRNADIERVRDENEALIASERDRRVRAEATASRQRRRQNEAVISALGGPPPDLERSVCELAGGVECGAASADDVGGSAAPADLPAGAGDSAGVADAVSAATGEPAAR